MRIFSRVGIVSIAAFAGFASPVSAQTELPVPALTGVTSGKSFRVSDATGHVLALHFVGDPGAATPFVRDYLTQAPTIAGVMHVFVADGDPAATKSWAATLGDSAGLVYLDGGRAFASDLKVPSIPATVVFGPDGREILRHIGASQSDYWAFASFAKELSLKAKAPALSDYNLPKAGAPAIQGYDPVAYFTNSAAVQGQPTLASTYRGVTYHFASAEHRRVFAANPEKYIPTYGGWCASAMGAKGTKVEIDPTNFKVKNGRLFLFYKGLLADALKDWNKHEAEWEPAADKNWKKLTGEGPSTPAP